MSSHRVRHRYTRWSPNLPQSPTLRRIEILIRICRRYSTSCFLHALIFVVVAVGRRGGAISRSCETIPVIPSVCPVSGSCDISVVIVRIRSRSQAVCDLRYRVWICVSCFSIGVRTDVRLACNVPYRAICIGMAERGGARGSRRGACEAVEIVVAEEDNFACTGIGVIRDVRYIADIVVRVEDVLKYFCKSTSTT